MTAAHGRGNAVTTEVFIVGWTIDYGYRLIPIEGGNLIFPIFVGEGTAEAFGEFFTKEALGRRVGRKAYCRCTGERAEVDGQVEFTIQKAELFVR